MGVHDLATAQLQMIADPSVVLRQARSAYAEGGIWLAVNQFNPVYALLMHPDQGWQLAQRGCITEASRALTSATIDAVSAVAMARGVSTIRVTGLKNRIATARQEMRANPDRGSISIPGRKNFDGETGPAEAFAHLKKYHSIDPRVASNRLHKLKTAGGLGAADNVVIGRTGDVYNPINGERLGSLTDKTLGGGKR